MHRLGPGKESKGVLRAINDQLHINRKRLREQAYQNMALEIVNTYKQQQLEQKEVPMDLEIAISEPLQANIAEFIKTGLMTEELINALSNSQFVSALNKKEKENIIVAAAQFHQLSILQLMLKNSDLTSKNDTLIAIIKKFTAPPLALNQLPLHSIQLFIDAGVDITGLPQFVEAIKYYHRLNESHELVKYLQSKYVHFDIPSGRVSWNATEHVKTLTESSFSESPQFMINRLVDYAEQGNILVVQYLIKSYPYPLYILQELQSLPSVDEIIKGYLTNLIREKQQQEDKQPQSYAEQPLRDISITTSIGLSFDKKRVISEKQFIPSPTPIWLALTTDKQTPESRLSAISDLPAINFFAAEYAIKRLATLTGVPDDFDTQLQIIAKYYNEYIEKTSTIIDPVIHDDYRLLSKDSELSSSFYVRQQLSGHVPTVIASLIAEYLHNADKLAMHSMMQVAAALEKAPQPKPIPAIKGSVKDTVELDEIQQPKLKKQRTEAQERNRLFDHSEQSSTSSGSENTTGKKTGKRKQ